MHACAAARITHSVPAHDPRCVPATPTELGPPRRALVDARDARERTAHGPRPASNASAAARGGRSARLGACDRARAIEPRSIPYFPPLDCEKKTTFAKKVLRGLTTSLTPNSNPNPSTNPNPHPLRWVFMYRWSNGRKRKFDREYPTECS